MCAVLIFELLMTMKLYPKLLPEIRWVLQCVEIDADNTYFIELFEFFGRQCSDVIEIMDTQSS